MPRRNKTSPAPVSHIVDVADPAFEPGDPVRVKGRRGKFFFVARRRNLRTGSEWLDVRGGTSGREQLRSLEPDLVGRA